MRPFSGSEAFADRAKYDMELLYGLELRPRLHVLPRMAAIENVVSIIVAVLVWPMFISLSLWAAWGG